MIQHLFIDRIHELSFLEKQYADSKASFIVLYGRRRVGKTELIRQFARNKPGVLFIATEGPQSLNIDEFSRQCSIFLEDSTFQEISFKNWDNIFSFLLNHKKFIEKSKTQKILLIFDEFPYLITTDSSVPSQFQKIWDTGLSNFPIMFILCGSSISIMESDVLGYKSPLYGRRTGQWKVNPLSFQYIQSFLPWENTDLVRAYSVLGGIPAYLQKFNPEIGFWGNITQNILEKGSYLYNEAEILLNYEFRQPGNYILLLKAIASGKVTMGEICNATGMDKGMVSKYLNTLMLLRIISDELPVTIHPGGRGKHYQIIDPYLLFWFRFIYPNRIDLEFYRVEEVKTIISQSFDHHCGQCYENIVRDLLNEKTLFADLQLKQIGRWWYKDTEIDVVGINEDRKIILFCEVKWSDLSLRDIKKLMKELQEKAEKVRWNNDKREEYYCIIGRTIPDSIQDVSSNFFCYDLNSLFGKIRNNPQ